MKITIHKLSRVLILPFLLIGLGILFYGESTGNYHATIWVIIPGILLVLTFVFAPQIDYWWLEKHPPELDFKVKKWLDTYIPFYQNLGKEEMKKFDQRLTLYMAGREFKSIGSEVYDVPEDVKGMIGWIPIALTLDKEDYLLEPYDRVYLYKHAFPSPNHQYLHTVEVNHEDGVLLFSMEHLLPGLINPRSFPFIGGYAFAEAYLTKFHPQGLGLPAMVDSLLPYNVEKFKEVAGLNDLDNDALWIVAGMTVPNALEKNHPEEFTMLSQIIPTFIHKD